MLKPTVRRSACDSCRAKRVRCLRAQGSIAPCARCSCIGAPCVTGASGSPGRPPKNRLSKGSQTLRSTVTRSAAVLPSSSASQYRLRSQELGDTRQQSSIATAPRLEIPKPATNPDLPNEMIAMDLQHQDFWAATGNDTSTPFDSPSVGPSPQSDGHVLTLEDQLSNTTQLQNLAKDHGDFSTMFDISLDSTTVLDMHIDPLLTQSMDLFAAPPRLTYFSAAISLLGFREEIDQHISTAEEYYSDTAKVLDRCKEEGAGHDPDNPATLLLTYSKRFADITQSLMTTATLNSPAKNTQDGLSTEIVLLALSSYLALMRLFDSLFHRMHQCLYKVPKESYASLKVKSVLRIGGFASLQDMPLKAYAISIVDAIQCQVQTVERIMGIPAEYRLSGKATVPSPVAVVPGILSSPDRTRLFWTAIAQEDVISRRGTKSYVESIQASIEESMEFFND